MDQAQYPEWAEGETRTVGWVRLTKIHNAGWFWLIFHWKAGEEGPWCLIADRPGGCNLIQIYALHMWVEEVYGDMKGHGFDLETTHLRVIDRISRLVLAVCMTFVWLIILGAWIVKRDFRHSSIARAGETRAISVSVGIGLPVVFVSAIRYQSGLRLFYESDMLLVFILQSAKSVSIPFHK